MSELFGGRRELVWREPFARARGDPRTSPRHVGVVLYLDTPSGCDPKNTTDRLARLREELLAGAGLPFDEDRDLELRELPKDAGRVGGSQGSRRRRGRRPSRSWSSRSTPGQGAPPCPIVPRRRRTSPPARRASVTRRPFTTVPFFEPRSWMWSPSTSTSSAAWRRETSGSVRRTVQAGETPMSVRDGPAVALEGVSAVRSRDDADEKGRTRRVGVARRPVQQAAGLFFRRHRDLDDRARS